MQADGQTDRHDETVTLRNFAKAPINSASFGSQSVRAPLSLYCPKAEGLNEKKTRKFSSCLVYCRMCTLTVKRSHKSKLHDNTWTAHPQS